MITQASQLPKRRESPFQCNSCGSFCNKIPSLRWDFYWQCKECNIRYPVGERSDKNKYWYS